MNSTEQIVTCWSQLNFLERLVANFTIHLSVHLKLFCFLMNCFCRAAFVVPFTFQD